MPRPGSGDYAHDWSLRVQPQNVRQGDGFVSESDRADLEALVAAADLHNQPNVFRSTVRVFDIPMNAIHFADKNGAKRIGIEFRATVPPEIDALVQKLQALKRGVPFFSTVEGGGFSGVTQAGNTIARDQAAYDVLWQQHRGSGATSHSSCVSLRYGSTCHRPLTDIAALPVWNRSTV